LSKRGTNSHFHHHLSKRFYRLRADPNQLEKKRKRFRFFRESSHVDVLFNHYRNLVKKSVAGKYWEIVPQEIPGIIQFPTAKAG